MRLANCSATAAVAAAATEAAAAMVAAAVQRSTMCATAPAHCIAHFLMQHFRCVRLPRCFHVAGPLPCDGLEQVTYMANAFSCTSCACASCILSGHTRLRQRVVQRLRQRVVQRLRQRVVFCTAGATTQYNKLYCQCRLQCRLALFQAGGCSAWPARASKGSCSQHAEHMLNT